MMKKKKQSNSRGEQGQPALSRRERQILDLLYREGKATAAEVEALLPDAPSYSAVRALLRVLEDKGHVVHAAEGARYVYTPALPREAAAASAAHHLVETFFKGSVAQTVATLLDASTVSEDEFTKLEALIDSARKEKEHD